MPRARDLALLAVTVLVWGYNWVPLKIGATAIDPWWFSAWRVAGGALALFAVLAVTRRGMAPPPGSAFVWVGFAQVAGLITFSTLALHAGGVANVTSLIFTMPVFTAILSYVILAERLSRARIAWLVVAASGIAVVACGIRGAGEITGGVLAVCGGASWALGNVLQRQAAYRIDLLRLVAWQQLVAAVPLLVLALAFGHPVARLDGTVIFAALFASIVGSGIAWLWWGASLARLSPNTVALASFAIPVVGALSAWVQLGSAPPAATAIGLAIVVIGLSGSVTVKPRASSLQSTPVAAECARSA